MTKKDKTSSAVAVAHSASADVRTAVNFGDPERAMARQMGINLEASADVRTEQAVFAQNVATYNLIQAGLLLSSVKSEMQPDEFEALIEARGLTKRRAYELMQGASFCARLPDGARDEVLHLQKSKVLALASADPEVVQAMLDDEDVDVSTMSVKALRERIRELEASVADRDVRLETAEAEAKAAKKAAKKDRSGDVPVAIFDIRAEAVAQVERSRLAVEEVQALGRDLVNLVGVDGVYQWVDPTARLAVTGLVALQVQIAGVLQQFREGFDLVDTAPAPMSYLTPDEVEEAAKRFADLIALHQHEKALRDWERQQERPRGKGRPAAKPEAPKTRGE